MVLITLIVQIITESLPISSSGHVALLRATALSRELLWIAHIPTICAMTLVLFPRWRVLLAHPCRTYKQWVHLIAYGACATGITVPLYTGISLSISPQFPLWMGFCITALLLSSLLLCKKPVQGLSISSALLLGCAQGIAAFPGISRLGITYVVGRWCGLSAAQSFDFSCTLALPVFAAAGLYGMYTVSYADTALLVQLTIPLLITTICAVLLLYATRMLLMRGYAWVFALYLLFPMFYAYCIGL